MFSPITVLANIFIVPLATLITLSGFSLIFAAITFPPLALPVAGACESLIAVLLYFNASLLKIPGAYFYFR
jgi:hypothetical protein